MKLVAGKVTFVHRSLWAALLRVVTDPGWRRAAVEGLSPPARRLLAQVERRGEVRLDVDRTEGPAERRRRAAARLEIERALLVRGEEVHTEKGSHATVLRSWERGTDRALRSEAGRLSFEDAWRAVRDACAALPSGVEAGMRRFPPAGAGRGRIPDPLRGIRR